MIRKSSSLDLSGVPDWITPDLITETIHVWQPYYADPLTVEDALDIIMNVGQFVKVISGDTEP